MLAASIGVCNGGFCLKALPCPQFFVRDGAYRLITAITQVGTSFRMAACGATASFARAPSKDRSQTELPTLAPARQPFLGQALSSGAAMFPLERPKTLFISQLNGIYRSAIFDFLFV